MDEEALSGSEEAFVKRIYQLYHQHRHQVRDKCKTFRTIEIIHVERSQYYKLLFIKYAVLVNIVLICQSTCPCFYTAMHIGRDVHAKD